MIKKLQKMNINLKTNIMKTTIQKLGMIICSFLFLVSCTKKDEQIVSQPDNTPVSTTSMLKFSGMLSPKPNESGTGTANIYLDKMVYTLKFEDFKITNGPDLKVYLSKDEGTSYIVNLGSLKTSGVQSYDIPASVNVADYKYVLIYCQQYSVLFTSASLMAK
jgi:Electron transfer DM13